MLSKLFFLHAMAEARKRKKVPRYDAFGNYLGDFAEDDDPAPPKEDAPAPAPAATPAPAPARSPQQLIHKLEFQDHPMAPWGDPGTPICE